MNILRIRQWMLMGLLGIICMTANGCFLLLVGAGTASGVMYYKGSLEHNLDKPVEKVHAAASKALSAEGYFVTEEVVNKHDSHIKAETESGKDVFVDVEALTEKACKIKIRFGVFGDELLSKELLTAIEKRL